MRKLTNKVLKAIHSAIRRMTELTGEERAKKLVELDKAIREIKSLSGGIRTVADKLKNIAEFMNDDVFRNADRIGGGSAYLRGPFQWEPSQFDLAKLKSDHLRLRELIQKRDALEKELGFMTR